MLKISVIGGGAGTFSVLFGLKKYNDICDINAIITSFDSGGSTGRLRDEFGYLPIGDLRQALVALGDANNKNSVLRQLFNYRFHSENSKLNGHNLGNLILTALTDILGNESKAIKQIGKVFDIKGQVIPITLERTISLWAQYSNGKIVKGESIIDEPSEFHDKSAKITSIWLDPKPQMNPQAKKSLLESNLIIFAPGDFYTSILPNVLVKGFKETFKKCQGKIIFIMNLISKFGQTHNMSAKDYIDTFQNYTGRYPHYILINKGKLPKDLLHHYAKENSFPIKDDLKNSKDYKIIRDKFFDSSKVKTVKGDLLKRSLIRHDPNTISKTIINLS